MVKIGISQLQKIMGQWKVEIKKTLKSTVQSLWNEVAKSRIDTMSAVMTEVRKSRLW